MAKFYVCLMNGWQVMDMVLVGELFEE